MLIEHIHRTQLSVYYKQVVAAIVQVFVDLV